jgi:hypothetical protein
LIQQAKNVARKILKLKDVTFVNSIQENWNVAVNILIILVVIFVTCILDLHFAVIYIMTIKAVTTVNSIQALNNVVQKIKIILHVIHVK